MSKRLSIAIAVLVLLLAGISFYLGVVKKDQKSEKSNLKVATSIFPLYDITKQIVGNKANVVLLLPVGESEHTFEPTPKEQEEVSDTRIVFLIGHGLDDWVKNLATSSTAEVVTVDKNISLKPNTDEDIESDGLDPHYWLSISNAMTISDNIADTLAQEDPSNTDYYKENSFKYKARLGQLKQELQQKMTTISDPEIVTFHEAFSYFAEEFNIEIVTSIEPFPGKEPTPAYLAEVREKIENAKVKVLFKEPQLSDSLINALASDLKINIYTLDPIGGVTGRDTYEKLIEYNINTIIEALNSK